MTRNEIQRRFPKASNAFIRANLDIESAGPVAVVECDSGDAPMDAEKVQRQAGARFFVRVESVRRRLLDEDNLCEKYHVDLCRYAGAIPSDAPGTTKIEVTQRKALKGEAEHTLITIT